MYGISGCLITIIIIKSLRGLIVLVGLCRGGLVSGDVLGELIGIVKGEDYGDAFWFVLGR